MRKITKFSTILLLNFFCLTIAYNLYAQIPTDSLKLYVPFKSGAIDVVSGKECNVFGSQLANDRFGHQTSAYNYDGIDNYIACDTNNLGINSQFCISAWVKTTDTTYQWILGKYNWYEDAGYHIIMQQGIPSVNGRDGNNVYTRCISGNAINDNKWHNVVANVKDSVWQLWVDGILEAETITNHTTVGFNNSAPLEFGRYFLGDDSGDNLYFNGVIDDIRIYNKSLDSTSIKYLYYGDCVGGDVKYDTVQVHVYDTVQVNVYDTIQVVDSISVTDTLIINMRVAGVSSNDFMATIKAYPNPTNGTLSVSIPGYAKIKNYKIRIINVASKVIYESNLDQELMQIDLSGLGNKGMHFLQIYDDNFVLLHSKKILIE